MSRGGGGILKKPKKIEKINSNNTTDIEINNKIEDIDFLSKFKQSQKKIESGLRGENKEENKDSNNKDKLRKSTLKKWNFI